MIAIQDLHKRFGKFNALQAIHLQMEMGQAIALIGPNGSGKTTLIKCLLGMVLPTQGDIRFEGKSILHQHLYREQIGYMPQIGHYPGNMKISQLIAMMKDLRKTQGTYLDEELLLAFEIDKIAHKPMRTLSGGMRQKVSACLAFLFNPKVLILDEPTAGLDPLATEILKEKIRQEKQKGKLILITSHILSDLEDIITDIVYLQDGQLQFYKTWLRLQNETGEKRLNRAIAQVMQNQTFTNHPLKKNLYEYQNS
ncbi:MAG: ABC transporter ATP-binding protein [Microscillaceae bacterium]|nr:ABC transporter ATP-binding protein [Microscillaceae bacterium]